MKKHTNLYALVLLIFIGLNPIFSQHNHDAGINFTIEDGLPSNECHSVLQDSSGYIWIATDRGLSRFDGYEFRNYGLQDGLADLCCLDLQLDSEQNIWINTLSKVLYKYIPASDTIVEYEYNSIIEKYHKNIKELDDFYVDSSGDLHISIEYIGILHISTDGISNMIDSELDYGCTFLYEFENYCFLVFDNVDKNGDLYSTDGKGFIPGSGNWHKKVPILFNNYKLKEELNVNWDFNKAKFIKKIPNSEYIYYSKGMVYHIMENQIKSSKRSESFNDLHLTNGNAFFVGYVYPHGLKKFKDLGAFMNNEFTSVLDSISISRIFVDVDNQLWASSLNHGVFLLKDNLVQSTKSLLKNSRISELLFVDDKLLFNANGKTIGVTDTLLYLYDTKIKIESKLYCIYYDDIEGNLIYGSSIINYFGLDEMKKSNILIKTRRAPPTKGITKLSNGDIFTINVDGISLYKNLLEEAYYSSYLEHGRIRFESVGQLNDSIVLLGGLRGIYKFNFIKKQLREVEFHPALNCRINDIQVADDFVLFGTQGNGVVIWDKGTEFKKISASDGLASNIIEKTYISKENRIFTCSFAGLSEIIFDDSGNFKITNYNRHNGLTTNEVLDVKVVNDKIFVATGKGINLITPKFISRKSKEVRISEVVVNSKKYDYKNAPNEFSHTEDNLTIFYKCIDVHKMGDILYRYKMNDEYWIETKSTYVNFSSLYSGNYEFAIQVKDEYGVWSSSSKYTFRISKPLWRTLGFILSLIAISFFIGYLLFRNKVNQLKLENKLNEEIKVLERSALQAQMNPHFIFNCLNSIQNFIMENKKEMAMNYLSDFSKLVRLNLQVSVDNRINVDTEVKLLDSYLQLEKLRLKDAFNYTIEVDKEIQQLVTYIPPMLIQPYVENAVLHGMKHRETGGVVKVAFQKKGQHLSINIFDNGTHYSDLGSNKEYKSLGMSITNKRLAYINQLDDIDFKVLPTVSDNGTTIHISIPFNHEV